MIRALDMVNDVQRSAAVGIVSTINATTDLDTLKILQELNYCAGMLGRFTSWRWLEKQAIIRTSADVTAGDADVTLGSDLVTSDNSSTAWTPDMVSWAFKTSAYEEIYRVSQVISPTSLRLTQVFNGTTATDGAYTLAQDTYALPADFDDTSELNVLQFVTPKDLTLLPSAEFDAMRFSEGGTGIIVDNPKTATIRGVENGRYLLVLHPFPDDAIQIVFNYYATVPKLSRDEDIWQWPEDYKPLFRDWALAHFRRNAQDDQRGQIDIQEFFLNRAELAGLRRPTDNQPIFEPDTGYRRTGRRRPSSARYDLGTYWDRN